MDPNICDCRRPYRVECTGSLLTSEVKRRRARLVLGWGTAREDLRVLSAFHTHGFSHSSLKAAVGTILVEKAHLFFLAEFLKFQTSSFPLSTCTLCDVILKDIFVHSWFSLHAFFMVMIRKLCSTAALACIP